MMEGPPKENLPELIARQQTENKHNKIILEAIREQQMELTRKTFISVLAVTENPSEIYSNSIISDYTATGYRKFISEMIDGFLEIDAENPIIAQRYEDQQETSKQRTEILKRYSDERSYILNVWYNPPKNPDDILLHLQLIWRELETPGMIPSTIHAIVSLSLAKLQAAAYSVIADRVAKDSRDKPRTKKSTDTKKKGKSSNESQVEEAFFQLTFQDGDKLNSVVMRIKDKVKTLHEQTIRRYLMQSERMMKYFKQEGKFWIYKM
jgi:hypothetical protein